MDYLLKPFGPTRLAEAMERVRAGLGDPLGIGAPVSRNRAQEIRSLGG